MSSVADQSVWLLHGFQVTDGVVDHRSLTIRTIKVFQAKFVHRLKRYLVVNRLVGSKRKKTSVILRGKVGGQVRGTRQVSLI